MTTLVAGAMLMKMRMYAGYPFRETMPTLVLLDNVELALHEKLVVFVENVQHVILVVVARVLATSCPTLRPRT